MGNIFPAITLFRGGYNYPRVLLLLMLNFYPFTRKIVPSLHSWTSSNCWIFLLYTIDLVIAITTSMLMVDGLIIQPNLKRTKKLLLSCVSYIIGCWYVSPDQIKEDVNFILAPILQSFCLNPLNKGILSQFKYN